MGWLIWALLGAAAFVAIWRLARPPRALLQFVAAAVLLAGAGYAWQGSPGLPGKPVPPRSARGGIDTDFAAERGRFLERLGADAQLLDAADALIRNGAEDYAVGVLRSGLAKRPDSADLWLGLGNALAVHSDGAVTPAALYCFSRAAELAPGQPAPPYFLALAYAQEGDLDRAERIWRALLIGAPPGVPWREAVAEKLLLVRQVRLLQQGR